MDKNPQYWFPAKRYGWGWGIPNTWQGWLVLVAYGMALGFGIFFFPPESDSRLFVTYLSACSAVLILVCWQKGEPPAWRWGGK